eukprot:148990_1
MGGTESRQKLTERIKETKQTLTKQIAKQTQRVNEMRNKNPYLLDLLLENLSYSLKSRGNFSEDTLIASWIANKAKCEKILLDTFEDTLKPPINKEEYLWFRSNIVNSPILLLTDSTNNGLLYDKLLNIARRYALETETKMNGIYDEMNKHKAKWDELMNVKNESLIVRQDHKKVGLLSNKTLYSMEEKHDDVDDPEHKANVSEFIDIHMAINELVAVANNLDDEFQEYIQTTMKDLGEFHPGPIKTYSRCQAKTQNDYSDAMFPHSARLLDLIRCSLTFDNLSKMLIGFNYFIDFCGENKQKLEIARIKNGFLESTDNSGGYRDIKVNVVYRSEKHEKAMICEVQFILRPFLLHKKKAHKLYSINRQQIFFEMASNAYYGQTGDENQSPLKGIQKVYETVNFEKYGTTTGEMHCSISSKHGVVASYNASENQIVVNDFKNRKELNTIIGVQRRSRMIAGGTLFAFVQKNKSDAIQIWNADASKQSEEIILKAKYGGGKWDIYDFNLDQDGHLVIIGSKEDNKLLIYRKEYSQWKETNRINMSDEYKITASCKLSLSSTGEYVSIANGWQSKYFYHISVKYKKIKSYEIEGCVGSMASCYYTNTRDRTLLICAGCKKKPPFQSTISVWDVSKASTPVVKQIVLDEKEGQIRCLIAKDNKLIAASGIVNKFSKIKVWDLKTWQMVYDQEMDMKIVNYLDLSEDGKYLAISGNGKRTLIVLELK